MIVARLEFWPIAELHAAEPGAHAWRARRSGRTGRARASECWNREVHLQSEQRLACEPPSPCWRLLTGNQSSRPHSSNDDEMCHPSGSRWQDEGSARHRTILGGSDFDHLEIGFGDATVRAGPGFGNVFPARSRLDAVIGPAIGLTVEEATNHAHECSKRDISLGHHRFCKS